MAVDTVMNDKSTMNRKKGVLLINLGTTSSPEPGPTGHYLSEFLFDPLVIGGFKWWRWILVHLFIVPLRKKRSAQGYKKIWLPDGSPLLVLSEQLKNALQIQMVSEAYVSLGMRYGEPSLKRAMEELRKEKIEELFVLPLYPQFADSSTTTALFEVEQQLNLLKKDHQLKWKVKVLTEFFWYPKYIEIQAQIILEKVLQYKPDHLIFSYHGLPESHMLRRKDLKNICQFTDSCCDQWGPSNQYCYRAQCLALTRNLNEWIIKKMNDPKKVSTSFAFQSRLGREKWLSPSLELELKTLAFQGVKSVLVACPSFVVDCLETLEEVRLRMRDYFRGWGGQELYLVPSLNDHPQWVQALKQLVLESNEWKEGEDVLLTMRNSLRIT